LLGRKWHGFRTRLRSETSAIFRYGSLENVVQKVIDDSFCIIIKLLRGRFLLRQHERSSRNWATRNRLGLSRGRSYSHWRLRLRMIGAVVGDGAFEHIVQKPVDHLHRVWLMGGTK
jgi:hypothetical protein